MIAIGDSLTGPTNDPLWNTQPPYSGTTGGAWLQNAPNPADIRFVAGGGVNAPFNQPYLKTRSVTLPQANIIGGAISVQAETAFQPGVIGSGEYTWEFKVYVENSASFARTASLLLVNGKTYCRAILLVAGVQYEVGDIPQGLHSYNLIYEDGEKARLLIDGATFYTAPAESVIPAGDGVGLEIGVWSRPGGTFTPPVVKSLSFAATEFSSVTEITRSNNTLANFKRFVNPFGFQKGKS